MTMGKKFEDRIKRLQAKVNKCFDAMEADSQKFDGGTKSAAARLRKALQEVKKLSDEKIKELRQKITDKKKSM